MKQRPEQNYVMCTSKQQRILEFCNERYSEIPQRIRNKKNNKNNDDFKNQLTWNSDWGQAVF